MYNYFACTCTSTIRLLVPHMGQVTKCFALTQVLIIKYGCACTLCLSPHY